MMKRQRGRGRKPGHHNQPNRALESNGPDIKVRGPASVIYEKYMQLARDAASGGDRVQAENYQQHAEHYFRLLKSMQPAYAPPPPPDRFAGDEEFDGDEEGVAEAGAEGGESDEVRGEAAANGESHYDQQGGEGYRNDFRSGRNRGRNRRNRFRPDGDRGDRGEGFENRRDAAVQEGREDYEPRRERPDRPPRDRDGERPQRADRDDRPPRIEREDGEREARRPRRERREEPGGFAGDAPAFLAPADED
ncbi:MAG: DUF4167 domain-containing protein [Hydrogenophilaceae bacterium]|jgi:hypothetical protein|nr:DUF4167 domain-containing protein [Hydrogenophilaceae bacterium]